MADELGARHQIHPYRRANFLTGYANTFPAILPFISAFIFISASSIEPLLEEYSYLPAVTPLQIFSGAFYPMVLFVVLTVSILTGWDLDFMRARTARFSTKSPDYKKGWNQTGSSLFQP